MLTVEELNEVVRKINNDEIEDIKVIDFFVKLQNLLNDEFDNETLMKFRKELEFVEV